MIEAQDSAQKKNDVWLVKEKLALASAVNRSGDQNWVSVSRCIKPFIDSTRPSEFYSQISCAKQYGEMLAGVEAPKRKRNDKDITETAGEIIIRRLTSERLEELNNDLERFVKEYKGLQKQLQLIKSGQADEQLKEIFQQLNQNRNKTKTKPCTKPQSPETDEQTNQNAPSSILTPIKTAAATSPAKPIIGSVSKVATSGGLISSMNTNNIFENLKNKLGPVIRSSQDVVKNECDNKEGDEVEKVDEAKMEDDNDVCDSEDKEVEDKKVETEEKEEVVCNEEIKEKKKEVCDGGMDDSKEKVETVQPEGDDIIISTEEIVEGQSVMEKEEEEENDGKVPVDNDDEIVKNVEIPNEGGEEERDLVADPVKDEEDKQNGGDAKADDVKEEEEEEKEISKIDDQENIFTVTIKEGQNKDQNDDNKLEETHQKDEQEIDDENIETKAEEVDIAVKNESISGSVASTTSTTVDNTSCKPNGDSIINPATDIKIEKNKAEEEEDNDEVPKNLKTKGKKKEKKRRSYFKKNTKEEVNDESSTNFQQKVDTSDDDRRLVESGSRPSRSSIDLSESLPTSPASVCTNDTEDDRAYKAWKKSIMLVWRSIANHKFANTFMHPVTEDIAPGYQTVVFKPMDLSTIRKNLDTGVIRTTREFQRDVMLMFTNALMYNTSSHDVHTMAKTMYRDSMNDIEQFVSTQVMVNSETKLLRALRRVEASDKEDEGKKKKVTDTENQPVTKKRKH